MIRHFVRGVFDGDGCVTGSERTVVSFTSASPKFMSSLQKLIYTEVGVRLKGKNLYPPVQNGKQISYSGRNAELILSWMYDSSAKSSRLDRKFNRYITRRQHVKRSSFQID